MFKLNFKIALRNLWRNRTSSLINIGGLAIGLSSCLLLMLYAGYELGYDRQYKNAGRIYQAMVNAYDENGSITKTHGSTQNALAPELKDRYPGVEQAARATDLYQRLVAYHGRSLKLNNRYADPDFLQIFDYEYISGSPEKALSEPNSILLTEHAAKRLFGTTDVVNRAVKFENQADLKVTAVIRDLPANVSYPFETLVPWKVYERLNTWVSRMNWGNHDFLTLVKLNPNANVAAINAELGGIVKRHMPAAKETIFIYPLTKLHLYGEFVNGKNTGGKIQQVRIFVGLALGILLIACINFMNLATAHAQKRAKEIGIKKTIGATKALLIFQFLLESLILTTVSILISIAVVELCIPWFNHLLDITIVIDYFDPVNWLVLLSVLLLTGFVAGSYPAFYLSSFNPVQALKKSLNFKHAYSLNLRQLLVIIQFSFAIVLIAATVTVYKQLQFIKDRPLGYNSDALVEITHEGLLYEKYELLKNRLLAEGAVVGVTQSSGSLTNRDGTIRDLQWEGMSAADKLIDFDQIYTTYDFIQTTGITLLAGRDFSKKFASDTAGILLSKKAVEAMGLKNPIGARIINQGESRTVIGVFNDMVWGDRTKFAVPMVITFEKGISEEITMRLNPAKSITGSTALIEHIVHELNPNFPVDIRFLDKLNEVKLKNEATLAKLSNVFGGLAIFISCLGLFGLSAFSIEQRTKEIGVRKVLGASVAELTTLLSLNFIKLVGIAIIIAMPAAYLLMDNWLDSVEVRTAMSWWIFILTAGFTLVIAMVTVSWQTYAAAKANPVKALKYE